MRIVYVNLHNNGFFVQTIKRRLSGRKDITKHRFLLEWMLKNHVEVADYITPTCNPLPSKPLRRITGGKRLQVMLAKLVFRMNHIPKGSIQIMTDTDALRADDVVVYYPAFDETQFDMIDQVKGIKVVDHIHFFGDSEMAERLRGKEIGYYFFEVNLKKYSKVFQQNYDWFTGQYIERPFAYEERFVNRDDFRNRKNKAMAIGTLTVCPPDMAEIYGGSYQPRRKMILDHAAELDNVLDSYISKYEETDLKKIEPNDSVFTRYYKLTYNYFVGGKQKKYFSFNMVDKFNEYKMFICPEDTHGSYGIGTIEGMACGCAMIGWDYGAFEDMGMTAGVHYIAYDGTLEDLRAKIAYYQMDEHQEELEWIARNGCEYVRSHYSQEKVAEQYYHHLKQMGS